MNTGETFYDLYGELWVAIKIDHKWNGEWVLAEIADGDAQYWFDPSAMQAIANEQQKYELIDGLS